MAKNYATAEFYSQGSITSGANAGSSLESYIARCDACKYGGQPARSRQATQGEADAHNAEHHPEIGGAAQP